MMSTFNAPFGEHGLYVHEADFNEALASYTIVDQTDAIREAKIDTTYQDDTVRVFSRARRGKPENRDLLEKNHLYSVTNDTGTSSVNILTRYNLHDFDELKQLIMGHSKDTTIPCYLDKETNTLVISVDPEYSYETVHHGTSQGLHRDTYKAVIITRGLAHIRKNDPSTIIGVAEVDDKFIQAANIFSEDGILAIDIVSNKLSSESLAVVTALGIMPFERYVKEFCGVTSPELQDKLNLLRIESEQSLEATMARRISKCFLSHYEEARDAPNYSHIIFSPSLFREDLDDAELRRPSRYYSNGADREDYLLCMQLLVEGKSIPVSVIAYRTSEDEIAFSVGQNHRDALRFLQMQSKDSSPSDSLKVLCEFNASLCVDINMLDANNLSELKMNSRIPLVLTLKDVRPTTLVDTSFDGELNGEGIVGEFYSKYRNRDPNLKVIYQQQLD